MKATRVKRLFFSVLFSTAISSLIFSFEKQPLKTSSLEEGLWRAVKGHDLTNVKRAIELRANINGRGRKNSCTPLSLAMNMGLSMENNNSAIVTLLIDNGARVNEEKTFKHTPHPALYSQSGLHSFAQHLRLAKLSREIKRYKQKENNLRDLIYFAYLGNLQKLTSLLSKKKVEIDQQNDDGLTALLCATKEGHTTTVTLLLAYNADVNQQIYENDPTPLAVAATHGHLQITELLLKYKADIDRKINNKHTALMFAASQGHTEIVKLLLEYNADSTIEGRDN